MLELELAARPVAFICSRHEQSTTNRRGTPLSLPLVVSRDISPALNEKIIAGEYSLLGDLLALLALLLGAIGGSGLLLDAVELLDHESARDSTQG